jgi:tRNA (adenine22-N1)-methyltransferase
MADIGCDHGYVAIELVRSGVCCRVVAMDVNKGPLERANENIRECGLGDKIKTRLSNGTKALSSGEVSGMICAGMGGKLIISILEEGEKVVSGMGQIILQPQSEVCEVRYYLRSNGFRTIKEDMVLEDGKYYPMMSVVKTDSRDCEVSDQKRIFDMYGRLLLETAHPILKGYLLKQREGLFVIREGLINQQNKNLRQIERIGELDRQLEDIEFCLKNYYKVL